MSKNKKLWLVCSIFAVVPVSLTACSEDPSSTLSKANTELSENDFVAARLYLLSYLQERSDDRGALMKLALSELFLGKGMEAQFALEKARKLGESPENGQDVYVEALLLQGQTEKAFVEIAKIPKAQSSRAALLKGRAFAMSGDAGNALRSLSEGLGKHPDDAEILAETARVRLALNDIERASVDVKAALKADPKSHEVLLVAGELSLAQGRVQEALERFNATLRLWPVSVRAMTGRAATEGELGQYDAMAKTLDAINGIDKNQRIAGLLRAQMLAKQNEWKRVLEIVEILGPKMVDHPLLYRLKGEAALADAKPEIATKALSRYLAKKPDDRGATLLFAQAQLATGDASSALKSLKQYADSPSASPTELRVMAKIAKALKHPNALDYEKKSQTPLPAFMADRLGRGNAALADNRWAVAIEIYKELNQSTGGKDPLVNNNLGWALYKARQIDASLKHLSIAAAAAPENASVAHSYGTVLFASGQDLGKALLLLAKASELAPANPRYSADYKKAKAAR